MIPQDTDYKRLMLAVFLAAAVLFGWQALVEWPKRQQLAHYAQQKAKQRNLQIQEHIATLPAKENEAEDNPALTREQRLHIGPRLTISSEKLHGSIALTGARFDDLTLARYHETLDANSPEVTLFTPHGDSEAYFAQIGWVAADGTKVPDQHTLWKSDKAQLSVGNTVNLRWNNGAGVTFILAISLDADYMFSVTQKIENASGHAVSVTPYAYINRHYVTPAQANAMLHEGPLGVLDGALNEITYKDLHDKGTQTFEHATGWLGITDKYWQSAFIPQGSFKGTFSHYSKNGERYQVDYLGETQQVENGAQAEAHTRLFAGAKEISVLDRYTKGDNGEPPVTLFDRSVDFGNLYFLTKPMLVYLLIPFYHLSGNFGIAILLLTICVKLVLFPLANKSYKSMSQMRVLQPEIAKLKERFGDDKLKLQQETMAFYKREKVNPAAGCLPLIIQMPVFFALYKVLFVTIEMRHAPFFGWIKDLSALDPSNIFTLFGLVPWSPPPMLHLGILPIIYCATMIIQTKQQPKPADPVQAKMMNIMPFFLLVVFARFSAGLVVYWIWNNTLSIIQQRIIALRHR